MASMADPYSKLGWAKTHIETLEGKLLSFCNTPAEAYSVSRYDDIEHQQHIIEVKLKDIPPEIGLIAGDAFYSMRSSLDQAVWALAAIKGQPGRTQFPIVEVWNVEGRKRFERQTAGIPTEAFCEIQALQPYNRGAAFKSHPLWRLDEICNLDKHRRIARNSTVLRGMFYGVNEPDIIKEATNDCHIVRIPLALKDKLRFQPETSVEVTFGGDKSGITETLDSIIQIYHFVNLEVLPRFDRFFP